MMRLVPGITIIAICGGCGHAPSTSATASATTSAAAPVKITQFYASDKKIPRGLKGNLCYGVEHASKVELTPAADVVWPAAVRCIEISPKQNTTYTLTAYG